MCRDFLTSDTIDLLCPVNIIPTQIKEFLKPLSELCSTLGTGPNFSHAKEEMESKLERKKIDGNLF